MNTPGNEVPDEDVEEPTQYEGVESASEVQDPDVEGATDD